MRGKPKYYFFKKIETNEFRILLIQIRTENKYGEMKFRQGVSQNYTRICQISIFGMTKIFPGRCNFHFQNKTVKKRVFGSVF
jgi:hypothetical protein